MTQRINVSLREDVLEVLDALAAQDAAETGVKVNRGGTVARLALEERRRRAERAEKKDRAGA